MEKEYFIADFVVLRKLTQDVSKSNFGPFRTTHKWYGRKYFQLVCRVLYLISISFFMVDKD